VIGIDEDSAERLRAMVRSDLLFRQHLVAWAEWQIERLDDPPAWVCDMATITRRQEAGQILGGLLRNHQEADPEQGRLYRYACVLQRYLRGEIAWATFLRLAGELADRDLSGGQIDCSFFYGRLTDLEDQEFDHALEAEQRAEVRAVLKEAPQQVTDDYEPLRPLFRDFVQRESRRT
jgi:hypothetical protein